MAGKEPGSGIGPSHRVVSSFPSKQWELFESICEQAGMDGRHGLKHLVAHCAITGSLLTPKAAEQPKSVMTVEEP